MKYFKLQILFTICFISAGINSEAQSDKIKVYFNNTVNNSGSSLVDAQNIGNFRDTIIAYIDRVQNTLDVCNYNTGDLSIVTAINAAKTRGVTVRYIGSSTALGNNDELGSLSSTIPVIQRPSDGEIMHNKFMIFDVANANNATIMSGSVNHTNNSLESDYNNLIFIQDQNLAQAYKIEFEEMWGSNTNTPNITNAKFGADKTDNTPHNFTVDGIAIELYFSPSDNTESHIVSTLQTANNDINFAMLTYTSNAIGDAMVNRQNAGVICRGVIHNTLYFGSEYNSLLSAGVDVISTQTSTTITHHKYAIVDAGDVNSDPIVITGSHNWSNSAEDDYDENLLIIHDKYIAHLYLEEFLARRPLISNVNENNNDLVAAYPNPVSESLTIENNNPILSYQVIDNLGKICFQQQNINTNKTTLDFSNLSLGIYILNIMTSEGKYQQIITKQ
jgi:phosphatidylserine/phosphatidylglycerophosphate/cardiolipin synthase-like enzyme